MEVWAQGYKNRVSLPFFNEQRECERGPLEAKKPRCMPKTISTFDRSMISKQTMSRANIEHGIVKDLVYIILLRMGNGQVIEILTMVSTLVERCEGKDFMAMRIISPKITKTY